MKIFSKYLVKEFIKLLLLCQIIFVFIYLFLDFVLKIENFVHAQVSAVFMLSFIIYKIPLIFTQILPVATHAMMGAGQLDIDRPPLIFQIKLIEQCNIPP